MAQAASAQTGGGADDSAPAPGGYGALSAPDFASLAERVMAISGIVLPTHKHQLVASRLRKRLRALGLGSFRGYLDYLDSSAGEGETGELINAITTNVTAFFRENHHFDDLARVLEGLKEVPANSLPGSGQPASIPRRIRIWSAACSNGEEPYSIAMTVLRAGLNPVRTDLRILATDLDTDALATAKDAIYSPERLESCPQDYGRRFFERQPDGRFRAIADLRAMVTYNRLNLHDPWPMRGPFDVIFCRNVLIYFEPKAKAAVVDRFVGLMRPGGTLYLGHSESMLGGHPELINCGRTIFRKRA